MRVKYGPYIFAAVFLLIAIFAGDIASVSDGGNEIASEAVSSSVGEIGSVLADALWLQLDQYHHIWMYQGNDWVTATDYLPQLWLIVKLDPTFADAYVDGGYHLAINLGRQEEGLELLNEGIRRCPGNEKILWEKLIVLWKSGYFGYRATEEAAWAYLDLVKKKRGQIVEPWNEANASMILQFTFEDDSLRLNHTRISERYAERSDFTRFARSEFFPE